MQEVYNFGTHAGYTLVVERLSSGAYEGIAFKVHPANPEFVVDSPSGWSCLDGLLELIDNNLGESP